MTARSRRSLRLDISGVRHRGLLALVATAMIIGGCAPAPAASGADDSLRVVATTTVFADIVAHVGGERITVSSIIPAGVGPEDYEPKPDDARAIDGADLIVSNGVGLDEFLDGLIEANGNGAPRLVLGDGIPTITVDGEPNPHFWLDPTIVSSHFVPAIEAKLSEIDPAGAVTYRANAGAYAAEIGAMDAELTTEADAIPTARRKLVTFHDAFPYFARHYGFELVGVILGSPGQEPSAGELAALIDTVKAAGVQAVFSEAQFSPALAETLAKEAGVTKVVTTLYNDALGPAPADTYLGMMRWNMTRIVEALR